MTHAAADDEQAPHSATSRPVGPTTRSDGAGERALMCAVLADAIRCMSQARRRPGPAAQARSWVMSNDREWPFSFENICDTLGFKIAQMRRRLVEETPSLYRLHDACRRTAPDEEASVSRAQTARATRNAAIVSRRAEGRPLAEIGRLFGLSTSQVANICNQAAPDRDRPKQDAISSRERMIVRLITQGLSPDDVGHRLAISPATVKTHLTHLYRDLGIHDRSGLEDYARRAGLEDPILPDAVDPGPAIAATGSW